MLSDTTGKFTLYLCLGRIAVIKCSVEPRPRERERGGQDCATYFSLNGDPDDTPHPLFLEGKLTKGTNEEREGEGRRTWAPEGRGGNVVVVVGGGE